MIGSINNATDVYAAQAATTAPRAQQPEEALANAPGLTRGEDSVEISTEALAASRFEPPNQPGETEDDGDDG